MEILSLSTCLIKFELTSKPFFTTYVMFNYCNDDNNYDNANILIIIIIMYGEGKNSKGSNRSLGYHDLLTGVTIPI